MSFDLCQVKQAEHPFYIEAIGTEIYSIEELCFYLYENVYLLDQSILNEQLCDWIRNELDLKRLARTLDEQLAKQDATIGFILPIFREIGYLSAAGMREYAENIGKINVQGADVRQKLKADHLVRSGMYESALQDYWEILDRQSPGLLSTQFYAGIWNNLGCLQARMFRFADAAESFYHAWQLTDTSQMLRKYGSVLPLYLSEEEYTLKLKELGADEELISRIQEQNLQICKEAENNTVPEAMGDPYELLTQLKKEYRRSAGES